MNATAIPYDIAVQSSLRNTAMVSVLADKQEDRHQITVKARTEADLIKKLFDDYRLLPCPVKDGIFRTAAECERVRLAHKGPTDKTAYARSIGYTGSRPVIVVDGKVTSHGRKEWFSFCNVIRDRAKLPR